MKPDFPSNDPRGPVFVAGCPRSGTSALGWAIAACPEYWTSVESHYFFNLLAEGGRNRIHEAFKMSTHAGSWLDKHEVTYEQFLKYLGKGLNDLMLSRSGAAEWVDNSPENLLAADDLLLMFPSAVFVYVIRDPRQVCASMLLSGFDREPWSHDLDEAIATWNHYAATGLSLESKWPGRVLRVMHHQMVHHPDSVASTLARFLNVPDASPIEFFLRSERVNSSYASTSKLAQQDGTLISASEDQRQTFWDQNASHVLARCQRNAKAFGFCGDDAATEQSPARRVV